MKLLAARPSPSQMRLILAVAAGATGPDIELPNGKPPPDSAAGAPPDAHAPPQATPKGRLSAGTAAGSRSTPFYSTLGPAGPAALSSLRASSLKAASRLRTEVPNDISTQPLIPRGSTAGAPTAQSQRQATAACQLHWLA